MKRFLIVLFQIVVSAELTLQILGLTEPWWSSRAGEGRAELVEWIPGKWTRWRLGDQTIEMEGPDDRTVSEARAGAGARIVMAAGPHPRAPLYGYIVDSMLPRVLSLLTPQ